LDVIEIDAASNRGIDEIRQLRERVNFSPNVARYKVYIIDEVHMLTEPASNALLKTLEEPPPYAIFILATTEPHKMLPTILSRCQRFDFRRLSQAAIASKLTYVCEKEGIHVDATAIRLIARSVSGSLRDAENLLEQLVAYYGYQIDVHQVEEILGVTTDSRVKELAKHVVNKDMTAGLATINSIMGEGLDLKQFNQALVEYLRGILLAKSGVEEALDLAPEDLAEAKELASRVSWEGILKAVRLFGQISFRFDDYSPLPLELALVECALPEAEKREEIATASAQSTTYGDEAEIKEEALEALPSNPDFEYIQAHWGDFVHTLRGAGSSGNLDAFLRSACEPIAVEDDTLVLGFYYSFHKEKIENPKYRHLVEKKLEEEFGTPGKIRCVLKPKDKKRAEEGHLVKAALEMGGRITSVEGRDGQTPDAPSTGITDQAS
jgi:DNA polymerase-3 subunit gamma/tau